MSGYIWWRQQQAHIIHIITKHSKIVSTAILSESEGTSDWQPPSPQASWQSRASGCSRRPPPTRSARRWFRCTGSSVIIMVSGGIKVVVGRGRILKEDLPSKLAPFVRIKAGSRIADSKKLTIDSLQTELAWNEALSLVFRDDSQLQIQLLNSDKRMPNYNMEIGVCLLNLEVLQAGHKQNIFGVFHNAGKLAAAIELEVTYETVIEEKVETAEVAETSVQHFPSEDVDVVEEEEPVYEKLTLNFKVLDAKLTHDTEALGDMKPYCLIKINYREYKTDVLKGKTPAWNQPFIFDDVKPEMTIEISIWDKETMKNDDLIGIGRLKVNDIMKQQNQVREVPLHYFEGSREKKAGSVRVEARVF